MKKSLSYTAVALLLGVSFTFAVEDDNGPITKAMKFAHKAPKGEKKVMEKIQEGTASEADTKKTLELYKAMLDAKPPKGDQADFKKRVEKVVVALQEVLDKKPGAEGHLKDATNCKACHSEHKES